MDFVNRSIPERQTENGAPAAGSFDLRTMLSEEHLAQNEIVVFRREEWARLFAWCEFLACRNGAYELYAPLVETLRRFPTAFDEKLVTGNGS